MKVIIQFLALLFCSCGTTPKQNVMFILPEGYSGFIWVAERQIIEENNLENEALVKILVNSKGVALVSNSCFKYLKNWTSYSTNLKNENHYLYDFGRVNDLRVYYYGTENDYKRDTTSQNIFEVIPENLK